MPEQFVTFDKNCHNEACLFKKLNTNKGSKPRFSCKSPNCTVIIELGKGRINKPTKKLKFTTDKNNPKIKNKLKLKF